MFASSFVCLCFHSIQNSILVVLPYVPNYCRNILGNLLARVITGGGRTVFDELFSATLVFCNGGVGLFVGQLEQVFNQLTRERA